MLYNNNNSTFFKIKGVIIRFYKKGNRKVYFVLLSDNDNDDKNIMIL